MKTGEILILFFSVLIVVLAVFVGYKVSVKHAGAPPRDYYVASAVADEGFALMRRKGCNSCHLYMKNGEFGVAPVLDGEGTKRGYEWIKSYINDPKGVIHETRHNGVHATDFQKGWTAGEREAVATFLDALRANPGSSNYPEPPTAQH